MTFERRDGKSPNHPIADPVERSEWIEKVWAMKRNNETYDTISEELGISRATAYKYFKEGLLMHAPPGAEEERIMLVQQLEQLLYVAQKIMDGTNDDETKLKAMDRVMKLYKVKRDLLGLDADKKFKVKHEHTTPMDEEIEELMGEFDQQLGKRDTERAARLANRRQGFRAP